jgi:hypothetical protein
MEMYSKDGCIQRQDVLEVKAYWAACEVILKAEEHPVVKAYLKALKFVKEQQKHAKVDDGRRFRDGKVAPVSGREPEKPPVPNVSKRVQEMKDETARAEEEAATHTKQQEKPSNIIYLPFMTPEVRACAKACGMGVEAYIKRVIQFANDAVKNEQARNIILNR